MNDPGVYEKNKDVNRFKNEDIDIVLKWLDSEVKNDIIHEEVLESPSGNEDQGQDK